MGGQEGQNARNKHVLSIFHDVLHNQPIPVYFPQRVAQVTNHVSLSTTRCPTNQYCLVLYYSTTRCPNSQYLAVLLSTINSFCPFPLAILILTVMLLSISLVLTAELHMSTTITSQFALCILTQVDEEQFKLFKSDASRLWHLIHFYNGVLELWMTLSVSLLPIMFLRRLATTAYAGKSCELFTFSPQCSMH